MAEEAKAKGNVAYSAKKFEEAITYYTFAISISPSDHTLYSNRSVAYASLCRFSEALADANQAVQLNPTWVKGYLRVGAAYYGLNRFKDAVLAYEEGLKIKPIDEPLKSTLISKLDEANTRMKNAQSIDDLKKLATLQARSVESQVENFVLEDEETLKISTSYKDDLLDCKNRLNKDLIDIKKRKGVISQEITDLNKEFEEFKNTEKEMTIELDSLNKQNSTVIQDITALKKGVDMDVHMADLESDIEELEDKKYRISQEITELKNQFDEFEIGDIDVAEIDRELTSLKEQKDLLVKDHADYQSIWH